MNVHGKDISATKVTDLDRKFNLKLAILRYHKMKLLWGIKCDSEEDKAKFLNLFGTNYVEADTAFEFSEFEKPSVKFTQKDNIILNFTSKQTADCFESKLINNLKDPAKGKNSIKELASLNQKTGRFNNISINPIIPQVLEGNKGIQD